MNRALSSEPEVTRDEVETLFAADLRPDMAQMPEHDKPQGGGLLAFVIWAAILSIVLGWTAWGAWF